MPDPKPAEELLQKTNEAYAALREDEETWKEELRERALWESTLMDGLEEYE